MQTPIGEVVTPLFEDGRPHRFLKLGIFLENSVSSLITGKNPKPILLPIGSRIF